MSHLGQVNALSHMGGVGALSQLGQVGGFGGFGAMLEQRRLGLMAAHDLIHGRHPGLVGTQQPHAGDAAFPGRTASPPPVAAGTGGTPGGVSQNETNSAAALLQLMGGVPIGDAGARDTSGIGATREPGRGHQPLAAQQPGNATQFGKQIFPQSAAAWRLVAGESGGTAGGGSGGGDAPETGPGTGRERGLNTQAPHTQNQQTQNQQQQARLELAGLQHLAATGGLAGGGGQFSMHNPHNRHNPNAGTLHNLQVLQILQQLQQLHSAASGPGAGGFGGDAGLMPGDFSHRSLFAHANQLGELHTLHSLGAAAALGHGGSPFASQRGLLNSANQLGLDVLHVLQAQAGNAPSDGGGGGGQTTAAAQRQRATRQSAGALHSATPNQAGVSAGGLGGFMAAMAANGDAAGALLGFQGFPGGGGGAGPQNGAPGLANDLETLRKLQRELGVRGPGLGAAGNGVDGLLHSNAAGRVPTPDTKPTSMRVASAHTLGQPGPATVPLMDAAAREMGVSAEMLAGKCATTPNRAALAVVTTETTGPCDPVDAGHEKETLPEGEAIALFRLIDPAEGGTHSLVTEKTPPEEPKKTGAETTETTDAER